MQAAITALEFPDFIPEAVPGLSFSQADDVWTIKFRQDKTDVVLALKYKDAARFQDVASNVQIGHFLHHAFTHFGVLRKTGMDPVLYWRFMIFSNFVRPMLLAGLEEDKPPEPEDPDVFQAVARMLADHYKQNNIGSPLRFWDSVVGLIRTSYLSFMDIAELKKDVFVREQLDELKEYK